MNLMNVAECCGIIVLAVFTTVLCGTLIVALKETKKKMELDNKEREIKLQAEIIEQAKFIEDSPFFNKMMGDK